MKMFKVKNLVTFVATGLLSTVLIGGISANADTLTTEVQSIDFSTIPSKVFDVYSLDSFYLSSVDFNNYSNSELSLEEYLVQNIKDFTTQIDISSYGINKSNSELIKNTLSKIRLTYPELFYMESNYSVASSIKSIKYIKLNYSCTKDEYSEQLSSIDSKCNDILSKLDDTMSEKEKALALHDYLCANFYYDHSGTVFDMYNFVEQGYGVCQAYMLTYTYLLNKVGIETHTVLSDEISHTWNMVKLDGEYYQIDVTWDDYNVELLGWANHNNFMLTDTEISNTHGSEWYMYDDISATDTTYSSCKFKSSNCPFVVINGNIFYIDNNAFCEYNFIDDSITKVSNLLSNDGWQDFIKSTDTLKYVYNSSYSSLNPYNNVIFYNTPDKIIAIDLNGNVLDVVYTHSSTTNAIYGINIQDGYLIAQFEPNLDTSRSDFASNINVVCNLQDWYTEYLNGSKTTTQPTTTTITTTQTTITTEPTTMTTTTSIDTTSQTTNTTTITTLDETSTQPTTITTTAVTTTVATTFTEETTSITTDITSTFNYDLNSDSNIDSKDLLCLKSYLIDRNSTESIYDVNNDGFENLLDLLTLKSKLLNG